jgi:ATP-binding cassette subfamily F protein 3
LIESIHEFNFFESGTGRPVVEGARGSTSFVFLLPAESVIFRASMIDFRNVSVGFGAQQVLNDVSFRINRGERVGIVGPNGAGKSTIFSLLTDESTPDRGEVSLPREIRVSHLRQQLKPASPDINLLEYSENALPSLIENQREIEALEERLNNADEVERERIIRRLGVLQSEFEHQGGYALSGRAKAALGGLGFKVSQFHSPFISFSGGWQMRAELARALVADPDLLLLDEPTNFLDIPAVEWLQRYLRDYKGTMVLISHDRYLLNSLTTVTMEVAGGMVTRYAGNFSKYEEDCRMRHAQLEAARGNQDRRREQIERFVERFRAKNTKSSQVQSRMKMLEKMDEIEVPRVVMRAPRIKVPKPPLCGVEMLRLEQAGVTYDGETWVLRGLDLRIERGEKIGLVGMNGMGKTTLLKAIAGRLPLNEGRRVIGHNVVIGYQAQDFAEMMDPTRTVLETVKAASANLSEREVRGVLGGFFFSGDAVDKKIAVLSGGEKMRVAFARLLMNPPNFLLLDEPTTHLDIPSREALENALHDYEGTVCLVSHDIEFTRHVATSILAMTPPTVRRFPGGYDYYHEKMEAEARAQGAVGSVQGAEGSGQGEGGDRKAARRERAEKRQELSKVRRPLENRIKAAEKKISELEQEQDQLSGELMKPAPGTDYASLNRRLHEIQATLAETVEKWEKASLELETLPKD